MLTNLTSFLWVIPIGAMLFLCPFLSALAMRRSLALRWQWLLLLGCLLYGFAPLLISTLGAELANQNNCTPYISVYKCPNQPELEEQLKLMSFAPWALLLTIPSALMGIIGMAVSISLKIRSVGQTTAMFYRSRHRRVLGGICAAIGQRSGLPVLGIRIAAVAITVMFYSLLALAYLWMWVAFPLEPKVEPSLGRDTSPL